MVLIRTGKEDIKMKTITTLEKTLKEIRKGRKTGKYESGIFGINACKGSIEWNKKNLNKSYEEQYVEYIQRALTEIGFNEIMIVACEELMNK